MKNRVKKILSLFVISILLLMVTACGSEMTGDTTPPGEVTNLKVYSYDGGILITWRDPEDADLLGIKIYNGESVERSIVSLSDGILVGKGIGRYEIGNLEDGKTYTFKISAVDKSLNESNTKTTEKVVFRVLKEEVERIINNYVCPRCYSSYDEPWQAAECCGAEIIEVEKTLYKYVCPKDHKQFDTAEEAANCCGVQIEYVDKEVEKIIYKYLCPRCGEEYDTAEEAMNCCGPIYVRVFICPRCQSEYATVEDAINCCGAEIIEVEKYVCPNAKHHPDDGESPWIYNTPWEAVNCCGPEIIEVKKYVCPVCGESYDSAENAKDCWNGCGEKIVEIKKYICPRCYSEYSTEWDAAHCCGPIETAYRYVCPRCYSEYETPDEAIECCGPAFQFICPRCYGEYDTVEEAANCCGAETIEVEKPVYIYICPKDHLQYDTAESAANCCGVQIEYVDREIEKIVKKFVCPRCEDEFGYKEYDTAEEAANCCGPIIKEIVIDRFVCPRCHSVYESVEEAANCCGAIIVEEKFYICPRCSSIYDSNWEALNCCGPEIVEVKKYICPRCENEYNTSNEASNCCGAEIIEIKKYVCPSCSSEYDSLQEALECCGPEIEQIKKYICSRDLREYDTAQEAINCCNPNNFTKLIAGQWTNGEIISEAEGGAGSQWFKFVATKPTEYLYLKDCSIDGIIANLYDTAFKVKQNIYLSYDGNNTDYSYEKVNLTVGEVYYINIRGYYNHAGTYEIGISEFPAKPGTVITTLNTDKWTSGSIEENAFGYDEQWFKLIATKSDEKVHLKFDTITSLAIRYYDANFNRIDNNSYRYWTNKEHGTIVYDTREFNFVPGEIYYVSLDGLGTEGSFWVGLHEFPAEPDVSIPYLVFDEWKTGEIISEEEGGSGEQWFKFAATGLTNQKIRIEFDSITALYISEYDADFNCIYRKGYWNGMKPSDFGTYSCNDVEPGEVHYIKLESYNGSSGTYSIKYTGENTEEDGSKYTRLTAKKWANGKLVKQSEGGPTENWYKFTADASTEYIFLKFGSVNHLDVYLYDEDLNQVGDRIDYDGSSGEVLYAKKSFESGKTYYIKVNPSSYSSDYGSYWIGFTSFPAQPESDIINLNSDIWINGKLVKQSEGGTGVNWYKFVAKASTEYIYLKFGSVNHLDVYLYDEDLNQIGNRIDYDGSSGEVLHATQTFESSKTYYIKVSPSNSSSDYGTYWIGLTSFPAQPESVITNLRADNWANGRLIRQSEGGPAENWYKFVANASTEYIYWKFSTATGLYVYLYDEDLNLIGTGISTYSSSGNVMNVTRKVEYGKTYYIKVLPYDTYYCSGYGSYWIGYSSEENVFE